MLLLLIKLIFVLILTLRVYILGLGLMAESAQVEASMYQPLARRYPFAAAVRGQLYVWGGLTESLATQKADDVATVDKFDPFLGQWVKLRPAGSPPLGWCNGASAGDDGHVFTYGGSDTKTYYDSLHQLDVETLTWTELSAHAVGGPVKKVACGLLYYECQLECHVVVFGGYSHMGPSDSIQPGACYEAGWTNELHTFDLTNGTLWHVRISHCM